MKTTSNWIVASLMGLACGAACTALGATYGDEQAPAWRPGDATAKFLFNDPSGTGTNYYATGGTFAPESGTGQIQLNLGGAYDHWKGTFPWATNFTIQGVWNVNPAGTMVATIPGTVTPAAVKYVAVQTVEFKYPWFTPGDGVTNIDFAFASVAVAGATQVGTVNEVTTGVQNGQGQPWVNRQTVWTLPAGASETVTITPQNNGSAFDSVIVDTIIVPNIVCPGNVGPVAGPPGGIVVNYTAPTPGVGGGIASQSCIPLSGSIFPQGVSTVNCTNTDVYGAQSTCSFTVTVVPAGASITGIVELEAFVGTEAEVTFVATDVSEMPVATWTQTLDFTLGPAAYSLSAVPMDTVRLSAKTPKNLRKRVDVDISGGSAVVDFVSPTAYLKGSDSDNDNFIGTTDYDQLVLEWFSDVPPLLADFDGDVFVGTTDYDMLVLNWFSEGDPE